MKTKVSILFCFALLLTAKGALYAQNTVSLDDAIKTAASEIESGLAQGVKVVVLNFGSASQRFSNYVLDEMMTALVRNRKITVVDRANLELIQQEINFQMSGEVSDSSAQAIGQKLGAQSIVSGNIEDMGTFYRMRFRTIEVESAAIQVLSSLNVQKDAQVAILMGGSGSGSGGTSNSSPSATRYPNGLNFSTGRKVGAGFANWIFGVGSFGMGDWVGGLIVGGIEVAGTAVAMVGLFKFIMATWPDYNDYITTEYSDGYSNPAYKAADVKADNDWTNGFIMMIAGAGTYGIGMIAGHVRPFTYDISLAKKRGTYMAAEIENPLYHLTLGPVYQGGEQKMGLLYSTSY